MSHSCEDGREEKIGTDVPNAQLRRVQMWYIKRGSSGTTIIPESTLGKEEFSYPEILKPMTSQKWGTTLRANGCMAGGLYSKR